MTYPKHSTSIPYSDPPSRLQTLDIWLPRPLEESDADKSLWIVYIHGGAWRDPLQTSSCADATVSHLSPTPTAIAGIASLNYRLSPYPSHPTHPSVPNDADRTVAHPTHVGDIATGIAYLRKQYGVKRWIGVGHSCGATMLCQYVSGIGTDDDDGRGGGGGGPEALVLSAGIYNLPLFLRNHAPPACPENIAQIYRDIVQGAFGDDAKLWQGVSPVAGKYGEQRWRNGKLIVLAHSYDDELVERQQRDVMCVALDREGWSIVMEDGDEEADVAVGGRVLEVRDIKGTHDFVWKDGEQCARLIEEVVQRLAH
ncbi:Alpha/Beta hydrolase protein [Phaeosphaeria sp. MPI-PUGE-AT-0046c]|nr:Alpha/Beta hydrolase protein [Phaeosphaeria sp. MPI-PUGE-AT-0046c]